MKVLNLKSVYFIVAFLFSTMVMNAQQGNGKWSYIDGNCVVFMQHHSVLWGLIEWDTEESRLCGGENIQLGDFD